MMPDVQQRPEDRDRAEPSAPVADSDLGRIERAIRGIQYGEVRVIIQDGVIVQIDRLKEEPLS
jgi:hypothetical protein